jgi:hypothetical protein
VQSAFRFQRASDGKTRVDSGAMSVISNPATGQTVVLDHAKKTALVQPAPPPAPPMAAPQTPQAGAPAFPGATPHPPGVQGQSLGKSVFQGHEVVGNRYVIQPPPPPKMGGMPKLPQMPGMPKAPSLPGAPASQSAPGAPGVAPPPPLPAATQKPAGPTTVETWTSTKLHLPMMTKMQGPFGQLTQVCHSAVPGEPHPAAFQIPPGYKLVTPPKPPGR